MREMAAKQTSFPARTPASAIRRRGSQGFSTYWRIGLLALSLLTLLSWPCPAAQSATLVWDANLEPDIAGYRVQYRTASGDSSGVFDVGNTTTFTVQNLVKGITYEFKVTAYNDASLEGQPSNEVWYRPALPPARRC